jgi:integrase
MIRMRAKEARIQTKIGDRHYRISQERWQAGDCLTDSVARAVEDDGTTMPFTREEMIRILAAPEPYRKSAGIRNAQRLRAFVLVLRYSGLRIGDAVQLDVNRIQENKLLLHTKKTGVAVYCVVPDVVVKALDAAPHCSARYFFWTGKSTVGSAKGKWQARFVLYPAQEYW